MILCKTVENYQFSKNQKLMITVLDESRVN